MKQKLVLASGSPRRKQLLEQLGLQFRIEKPDVDESVVPGESAETYVTRLSREKAEAVLKRINAGCVIVAADTTVEIDGEILSKPESREEGIAMLTKLSGRVHRVYTGVTVLSDAPVKSRAETFCMETFCVETFCVETKVQFRSLNRVEIECYWESGEPRDKAGGYGLQGQGAVFVDSLEGSYTNVIGLPLSETVVSIRAAGIPCMGVVGKEKDFVTEGGV